MFVDRAEIEVKGGDGGDGAVSFLREKHIPKGGPDGGDGGDGGDVVLLVKEGKTTLLDFRNQRRFPAEDGSDGGRKKQQGKSGDDLIIEVPPGTVVYDDQERLIADMVEEGQRHVVAKGGRGGRGNRRFKSSRHRTPRFAEQGEPGEKKTLHLELKLLADVGLVGLPNAGKSTLLSVISAARPEIADYPFTTLEPNLGVVKLDYERSIVVADLPGLIEGAHEGVGLGDEFLRHVERTGVLLHLVDLADPSGKDPTEAVRDIEEELRNYESQLLDKPRLLVGNKIDIPAAEQAWSEFQDWARQRDLKCTAISAVTGEGIDSLIQQTWEMLHKQRQRDNDTTEPEGFRVFRAREEDKPTRITQQDDEWVVQDPRFERWVAMTDLQNDEAVDYLNQRLQRAGLYSQLEKAGVQRGDTVRIGEVEFEYEPWG